MKQLELDFNSDDLSDHYEAYQVIDEGKNQICCWLDSLSDDGKKISYDEYTYNTPHCMDFENWIHIDKKCLKKTAYKSKKYIYHISYFLKKQIYFLYLKKIMNI